MPLWKWDAPEIRVFAYHALTDADGLPHPVCEPGDVVASDDDLTVLGFVPADEPESKPKGRKAETKEP